MPKGKFIPLTPVDEQFIKDQYLNLPIKKIAIRLNIGFGRVMNYLKKNGLSIPPEIVEARKKLGQRKPGDVPFNKGKKNVDWMSEQAMENMKKTQFIKGNLPHNTKYDGHERISKDGYVEVRLRQGKYRLKHIVEWEKINGTLPAGHCLLCQDGDKTNTSPDNWKMITRIENMLRNSKKKYPKELIPSLVLVSQINKTIKQHENEQ